MDYRTLGRTGLQVSTMGMGGGGPSRLGQRQDRPEVESVAILRQALDAGVNFIDTAEAYGTEEIVGRALQGIPREQVVLSSKISTGQRLTPADVLSRLEASLKRLDTDYIDIYHLHGVIVNDYDYLLHEIVPVLQAQQAQGRIGYIGITERFGSDTQHVMLQRALQDDVWDVMMVGFNILNQSARERVFAQTIAQDIGVLVMFAVRGALSTPESLREALQALAGQGGIDAHLLEKENPLDFVLAEGGAISLTDAAYRFCLYEPGTHVILSGTGNPEHLRQNLESFQRPPLPLAITQRLREMFEGVDSVSGNS